jgi:GT2 family glycosyltransferase
MATLESLPLGQGLRVLVFDNDGGLAGRDLPEGAERLGDGKNLGFCKVVNQGLSKAQREDWPYLLLLNNDTRLATGCLDTLVDSLEASRDLGGCGPVLLLPDGKTIWSAGSAIRYGPNLVKHLHEGEKVDLLAPDPFVVDFLPGACALYRVSALVRVGGLEETYFMYFEDADLGLSLQREGFGLVCIPWASARHGGSIASGGGASPLRKYLMGLNSVRFVRRNGGLGLFLAFLLIEVLAWPLGLGFYALGKPGRFRAHLSKGKGIFHGLLGKKANADVIRQEMGR